MLIHKWIDTFFDGHFYENTLTDYNIENISELWKTFSVAASLIIEYRGEVYILAETELVKRAKKGDDEAFLSLIHLHKETLYWTAISYLKDENKAVEAVQETTYRAFKNIRSLKKPEYFKTWLTKIIMNYCNDVLKKEKREITQDEILSLTGVEQDHTYLEVEEALNTLPVELQELVRLKYFQDLKIVEIADLWEAPEGTIKTKLHRALTALRVYFEEKGETKRV